MRLEQFRSFQIVLKPPVNFQKFLKSSGCSQKLSQNFLEASRSYLNNLEVSYKT